MVSSADLTRRIAELEAQQARLQALLSTLPDMSLFRFNRRGTCWDFTPDQKLQDAEQAAAKDDISARFPPSLRDAVSSYMRQTLDSGEMQTFEYSLPVVEGQPPCFEVRLIPWENDEGLAAIREVSTNQNTAAQLRELQQMFSTVLDAIPARVFWKDTNLTYLGCNRAFANDAGLSTPEAIIGADDYALGRVEQAELYRSDDRQVLDSGIPKINYEELQMRPDGSINWLQTSKIPLRDTNGAIWGVLGVYSDITEHKRAEGKLAAEHNLLHSLIDSLPDHIYVKDTDARFLVVNSALANHLGYDLTEALVGKTNAEVYPPDLATEIDQDDRKLIATGHMLVDHEEQTVTPDGQVQWVSTTKVPLLDKGGNSAGLVGISRDITQRKQAEVQLRESRQMLQAILDTIPVRVFWKDRDLIYRGCNKLFADDLGLDSPAAMVGKSDYDLYADPKDAEPFRTDDQQVIESECARLNYEEPQIRPDGSVYWLQTSKIPLRNTNGDVLGVLGVYQDITERKQSENRLRESEQMLRAILDNIPAYVFWRDQDLKLVGCNTQYAVISGFSAAEEVIGTTDLDLTPPEYAARLQADDRQILESGVARLNYEEEGLARDGNQCWFRTSKLPLRNAAGQVTGILGLFEDITQQKQAEAEREHLQQQVIEAQRQALQELSTPIIPVMDGIIVMPLIGSIDSVRAGDITRSLLSGISQHRAKIAILDITGVPVVDSGVADHLNRTIQAARLKGAQIFLTGISDAVAEAVVDLGIDWSEVETLRDLQSGLLVALQRLGFSLGRNRIR